MKKYLAEVLGTFILVFVGTGSVIVNDVAGGKVTHVGISLVFGLVVMAIIYAIGDNSGAHINPAMTLGFWLSRKLPAKEIIPYIGSQLVGAFAASAVLNVMFTHPTLGATLPTGSVWQSFTMEFFLTAILMFTVLCVATGSKEKGVLAGVAIGGVITFEALFGGPISGASMNPARSIAPAVVSGSLEHLWIYIAAPIAGAAAGVLGHKVIT